MSDPGNLRDRIADVIAGEEEHPHPRGYTAHAQAIIDEFGLHYETAHGGSYEHPNQRRRFIMGRWEKQ